MPVNSGHTGKILSEIQESKARIYAALRDIRETITQSDEVIHQTREYIREAKYAFGVR